MKIFVSKKVTNSGFLRFIESKNIDLIDQPMIDFKAVEFDCPKTDYKVIFFTSPRSAKFYLQQCDVPEFVNIATIGKSTTAFVESKGYKVDFTGETSGKPEVVASQFKVFVEGRKVLFPQSNHSHQSMQQALNAEQIVNLIVYKTILVPLPLEGTPSLLVFTSPTNARSFLIENKISNKQQVIAWGKTTERYLNKEGVEVDETLEYSSFEELTELLQKKFNASYS